MGQFQKIIGTRQKHEDCQTFESVLHDNSLPITVKLQGGVFTIQSRQKVIKLRCITSKLETVYLPADLDLSVTYTSVDNTGSYRNIEELRSYKKVNTIAWFVATKEFSVNEARYSVGQIFTFATSSLLNSFRRERQRGVYVLVYPGMKKIFLPMKVEGNFKKCASPKSPEIHLLSDLSRSEIGNYFIALPQSDLPLPFEHLANERLFVEEQHITDVILATKKTNGLFELHTLPTLSNLKVKVLHSAKPIDILDASELNTVIKSTKIFPKENAEKDFHLVSTYKELGITRLLEEIFVELSSKQFKGVDSPFNCRRLLKKVDNKIKESNYETIPTLSSDVGGNKIEHHAKPVIDIEQKPRKTSRFSRQSCHIYVNESPLNDEKKGNKRELVVEFDDGGYVVIPFTGKPTSSDKYYKSSDNAAYNYNCGDKEIDEHIYSYICTDVLDVYRELHPRSNNERNIDINSLDEANPRYSLSYDYPYIEHLKLPRNRRKQHFASLTVLEVSDVLNINGMKHHVITMREQCVNGERLVAMDEAGLIKNNFTRFEAKKLVCFIEGWRPLKDDSYDALWLTTIPRDWSVTCLSKYLLHVNMRSFHRFASRQNIDGYLLIELLKDNLLGSLRVQHSVMLKDQEIERLNKYILDDDKPKFKFFR